MTKSMSYAQQRLAMGVQRAIEQDKWGRKVTSPTTQRNYATNFAKFIGHSIPETAQSYIEGVNVANQMGAWDRKPTDLKKWAQAMEMIQ